MTTEQYQIGYEAGYSEGFDAGVKPADGYITIPRETFDAMREALKEAATSLETISRLAGRTHYVFDDGERLETHMGNYDQLRGYATSRASVAREVLSAAKAVVPQAQYSIDADPQGIRARVVSAVVGAMAYGASNTNKPPEGHWLNELWDIARVDANRVQPQAQGEVSWNLKYADSTPKLNVGHSAFEDWFQQQPFATQIGVKKLCRDAYAAGMGDPLVTYAHPQASEPEKWKLVPVEPTLDMLAALGFGGDKDVLIGHANVYQEMIDSYSAMLAAAPEATK